MTYLPKARQSELIIQEFEEETLIYDLKINKAFCLNTCVTEVWRLCDGTNSVPDIANSLNRRADIPFTDDIVRLALDQLKRCGLLQNGELLEINFNGLSRRQMIKKAGLTSMAALPVISSIVAPDAAMAASGCVNPGRAPAGTFLGGAGGTGFCSPSAANATCTSIRGNLCCSGRATADVCNDSAPGPNFGTYSVACRCA